jgi:hypothetical protein
VQLEQEVAITRAFFGLLGSAARGDAQTQAANRAQLSGAQSATTRAPRTAAGHRGGRERHRELLQRDLAIAQWRWA